MMAELAITSARDWSPHFSRASIGDGPVMRRLGQIQAETYAAVVQLNPDALVADEPFVAGNAAIMAALEGRTPIEAPPILTPIAGTYRYAGSFGTRPVEFVTPKMAQNRLCPFPAVTLLDGGVRPIDLRDHGATCTGWEDADTLEISYVPRPTPPARLQDELDAPEWLCPKIILELASWMATQTGAGSPELRDAVREARDNFPALVMARESGTSWYVWGG